MGLSPPARPQLVDPPLDATLGRLFDVVGALLLGLLGAPLLVVAAIAIALEDGGPPWFTQVRVGRYGRHFVIFKLRTMSVDAEARRASVRHLDDSEGPLFKSREDPRVTRVGRWLRRSSLDELPQVLNVLRGEMSLVGPRPALPEEVASYGPREHGRLLVKPGLTGLWQVSGRAELPFGEGIALDLDYVARRSVALDLWLLLRTVPAVLSGRGAC